MKRKHCMIVHMSLLTMLVCGITAPLFGMAIVFSLEKKVVTIGGNNSVLASIQYSSSLTIHYDSNEEDLDIDIYKIPCSAVTRKKIQLAPQRRVIDNTIEGRSTFSLDYFDETNPLYSAGRGNITYSFESAVFTQSICPVEVYLFNDYQIYMDFLSGDESAKNQAIESTCLYDDSLAFVDIRRSGFYFTGAVYQGNSSFVVDVSAVITTFDLGSYPSQFCRFTSEVKTCRVHVSDDTDTTCVFITAASYVQVILYDDVRLTKVLTLSLLGAVHLFLYTMFVVCILALGYKRRKKINFDEEYSCCAGTAAPADEQDLELVEK